MTETLLPPPGSAAVTAGAAVILTGLRKRYGRVTAVDGVDLLVAPGEVVALLGPNGAGKSTTIDMLLGLITPDTGTVHIFGRSPRAAVVAGQVCAMLQAWALRDSLTVAETVAEIAALHGGPWRSAEVLRLAGIEGISRRRCARAGQDCSARAAHRVRHHQSSPAARSTRAAFARTATPDVALIDVQMPGLDRLTAAAELHRPLPTVRIIICTTFGRPGYLARAMAAGAAGFVVKDAPPEYLVDAIRRVHDGLRVVDPGLAAESLASGFSTLTGREREVLRAAASGATVRDVAHQLRLSEGTVRNHLSSAVGKTGARTSAEAARIAESKGWL